MPSNCSDPAIVISDLSKTYQRQSTSPVAALSGISLTVSENEIVCLLGPSGCGKSTLLNIVAGLLEPTSGEVFVCGETGSRVNLQVSYIQQTPQLLPYRTVLANAALGLELRRSISDTTLTKLNELLHFLGLEDFLTSYPAELSGGMRQRVAFARTLAVETSIILCDEPLASVDFDNRLEIEDFFWRSNKAEGRASVFVTHHIDSAIALADRVVILSPRPGRVVDIINIDESLKRQPPLDRREAQSFATYFSDIWRSLRQASEVVT